MNDLTKLIGSIVIILLLGGMAFYFKVNGLEGTFVSSVQSLFIAGATGLLGGFGVIATRKGYKAIRGK